MESRASRITPTTRLIAAILVIGIAIAIVAYRRASHEREEATREARETRESIRDAVARNRAIDRAAEFLSHSGANQLDALLLMSMMHQRFGVPQFRGAPYLAASIATRQVDSLRFLRIVSPGYRAPDATVDAAEHAVDRITARALQCEQRPLPDDYAASLRAEMAQGRYRTTHAALGLIFLRDLGCLENASSDVGAVWPDARASIVAIREAGALDDLTYEAAVLSCVMGPCDVRPDYLRAVVDAQREDGSWIARSGDTRGSWHPTALATWLLLETTRPPRSPKLLATNGAGPSGR